MHLSTEWKAEAKQHVTEEAKLAKQKKKQQLKEIPKKVLAEKKQKEEEDVATEAEGKK